MPSLIHTTLGLEFSITIMIYSLGIYDYDTALDALDMPRWSRYSLKSVAGDKHLTTNNCSAHLTVSNL